MPRRPHGGADRQREVRGCGRADRQR